MKKTIIIDCKNLAQFSSGISGYFKPLLKATIEYYYEYNFKLLAPSFFDTNFIKEFTNWEIVIIKQKKFFNKSIDIIIYDLWTYPNAIKRIDACLLISPYYDFIIPACFRLKSIITVHDLCYWELSDRYSYKVKFYHKLLFNLNLSKANKIITVSFSSLLKIKNIVNAETFKKCVVVYNIYDNHQHETLYKKNNSHKKTLLYTGGFEQRKNVEMLLNVISSLKNDFDVKLIFTGNAKENVHLNYLIKNMNLENHIELTGVVCSKTLSQYYLECDMVLNLSLCEGFGRSNIEAMIYNKPLICSDLDVFREISGDYASYCNPYDLHNILETIKKTFISKNEISQNIDLNKFSTKENVKIYLKTIDEVLYAQ